MSLPVRDIPVSNAANNSTQTDTYTPNSTGTWTFVACKGSNAGACPSGQIANGSGSTFTVNPPADSTPPVITPNVSGTLGANLYGTPATCR